MWHRLLVLLVVASPAVAQPARVMREVEKQHWLTAEIITRGSDSLAVILHEAATPDTVPLYDLALVEVYRGRRISAPRVVMCTIGGLFLGGVVAWIASTAEERAREFGAVEYALYGVSIGGGVGLAVGFYPEQSWTQVHASPAAKRYIEDRRPWQ